MSESGPRVSVVVATRDRAARLPKLLSSLKRQTLPRDQFEVVIVDDASRDDTQDVLAEERARGDVDLRVVRRERSAGVAAARNEGWRTARGPVIAFTDDDCAASPGWLEAGVQAVERSGAVVQGRTDPAADELDRLGPFARTLQVTELGPWFQTCNIFYPRDLLERLGGFDQAAYGAMGGSDTDLAWRAKEAGAQLTFSADAKVEHAVSELGPLGKLRVAARWSDAVQLYARHPELRRELTYGFFWEGKASHYLLVRALVGLVLPRRLWPLRIWLIRPYLLHLAERGEREGGGLAVAPYNVVHDLVELFAVARGAVRHRVPVL